MDAREIAEVFFERARSIEQCVASKRKGWPGVDGMRSRARRYRHYSNALLDQVGDDRE